MFVTFRGLRSRFRRFKAIFQKCGGEGGKREPRRGGEKEEERISSKKNERGEEKNNGKKALDHFGEGREVGGY